jgi:hypothetical protein
MRMTVIVEVATRSMETLLTSLPAGDVPARETFRMV